MVIPAGEVATLSRSYRRAYCVVSPYTTLYHGIHHGDAFKIPEPSYVWTTVLDAAAPFRREIVCVVKEKGLPSDLQMKRVAEYSGFDSIRRIVVEKDIIHLPKEHENFALPKKHDESIPSKYTARSDTAERAKQRTKDDVEGDDDEAPPRLGNSFIDLTTKRKYGQLDVVSPVQSSLAVVPTESVDAVVFNGDALAGFGPAAIAHIISEAHRSLRPSGIFAVQGHAPTLRFASPRIQQDYLAYSAHLDGYRRSLVTSNTGILNDGAGPVPTATDARADVVIAEEGTVVQLLHDSDRKPLHSPTEGKLIAFLHECLETGFENIYFPFESMRKLWFTSCFELTYSEIIGYLRHDPTYRHLAAPAVSESTPGAVTRKPDPLEIFALCVDEELERVKREAGKATTGAGRLEGKHKRPTLQVEVDHFVITCDQRPVKRAARKVSTAPLPKR